MLPDAPRNPGRPAWPLEVPPLTRLRHIAQILRESLWFVPSLLTALAIGLALGCLEIDSALDGFDPGARAWLYAGGAEGARGVLSAIASSMITVAGVVFSVTIVALTLASQQYGPRLLRGFLRDRGNQFVIGNFVAVFVYCLLVLRAVHARNGDTQFVPNLSVSVAVALATLSAAVLIYFIHHSAVSLQPSNILASLSHELSGAIDRLFDSGGGGGMFAHSRVQRFWRDAHAGAMHISMNRDALFTLRGRIVLGLDPGPAQF